MATMTVYYIPANALRTGYVIVSAHHDWEPDGRLKPAEPYFVTSAKTEYRSNQGSSVVVALSHVPGKGTNSREFQPKERVAIRYVPIDGIQLEALENAVEVLTNFNYRDEATKIRELIKAHNTPPPADAVPATDWDRPPAPLAPPAGFAPQPAAEPVPPELAAPPSPFGI